MAVIAVVTALAITPSLILLDEWVLASGRWFSTLAPPIRNGLLPVMALLAVVAGFFGWVRIRFSASLNEAIQTGFVFLTTALVVLTITGSVFRGASMALTWLW